MGLGLRRSYFSTVFIFACISIVAGCTWMSGSITRIEFSSAGGGTTIDPLAPIFKAQGPWYVLSSGNIDVDTLYVSATSPGIAEDPSGKTMTITAVGSASYGSVVNSGNKITYTPTSATSTGRDQFTVTVTNSDGRATTSTISLHVVTAFTWTGGTSNTWDNATGSNWCGAVNANKNGCTNTGAVPGVGNTAIIDDTCVGANCTPTTNYNLTITGIKQTGGTLTMGAGNTITINGGGTWTQTGGTFNGGSGTISLDGSFIQTGGTFNAPGYISIGSAPVFSSSAAATFNHMSGTVWNWGGGATITLLNNSFYNLGFNFSCGQNATLASDITVSNDFTINANPGCPGSGILNGSYTSSIYGNLSINAGGVGGNTKIIGTNNQSILSDAVNGGYYNNVEIVKTGGTLTLGAQVYTTGNFIYNSGTVTTAGSLVANDGAGTLSLGTLQLNNLSITIYNGVNKTISGTNTILGNLTINGTGTGTMAGSGKIATAGNVVTNTSGNIYGDYTIEMNGALATNRTVQVTGGNIPNLTINSQGTVTFSGEIVVSTGFSHLQGTIVDGGNFLCMCGAALVKTLFAQSGTLTLDKIKYDGYSGAGDYLQLLSHINVNTFTVTKEDVQMNAFNLTVNTAAIDLVAVGNTIFKQGGTLTVNSVAIGGTGAMFNGQVQN